MELQDLVEIEQIKRLKYRSRSDPYSSKIRGAWIALSGERRLLRSIGWKCCASRLGISVNALALCINQRRPVFLCYRVQWQAFQQIKHLFARTAEAHTFR